MRNNAKRYVTFFTTHILKNYSNTIGYKKFITSKLFPIKLKRTQVHLHTHTIVLTHAHTFISSLFGSCFIQSFLACIRNQNNSISTIRFQQSTSEQRTQLVLPADTGVVNSLRLLASVWHTPIFHCTCLFVWIKRWTNFETHQVKRTSTVLLAEHISDGGSLSALFAKHTEDALFLKLVSLSEMLGVSIEVL